MDGQWNGRLKDNENAGVVTLDLDDAQDFYQGTVALFPDNSELPAYLAAIKTVDKSDHHHLQIRINSYDRKNNTFLSNASVENDPNRNHSRNGELEIWLSGDQIHYRLKTDIDLNFEGLFKKSRANQKSMISPVEGVGTWKAFKSYIENINIEDYIFRGQSEPFRLRTSFHRTKRKDLMRYESEDIHIVFRQLSALLPSKFNLNDTSDYGAFYNLIQHHGYPTPLLDWTFSPFIAAYFAYRSKREESKQDNGPVRILMFNSKVWQEQRPQLRMVTRVPPHFSILELAGFGNPRMAPQQSITTLTNVDDIEAYLLYNEQEMKEEILTAFDLDYEDRENALRDLRHMGITAASMFPGIDGTCEAIKNQLFGY